MSSNDRIPDDVKAGATGVILSTEILFTLVALFGVLFLLVLVDLRWTKKSIEQRETTRARHLADLEMRLDRLQKTFEGKKAQTGAVPPVDGGTGSNRIRLSKKVEDLDALQQSLWTTVRDDHEHLEAALLELKMLSAEIEGLRSLLESFQDR